MTLMDCVAGRKTIGAISGEILVNGYSKEQATWSRVMGYVEQMDIHTPDQTVIEALLFSARFRLPSSMNKEQVRAYVDEVLDMVDLSEIMFDLVGLPAQSGLSVEQRKRLTIANEMVANPSVRFMDEPTSGLDARAAVIVMRAVRNIGHANRAVVVTLHPPSIEILESFDNLLLLQRGGRISFFGPLGLESSQLVDYLQGVQARDQSCDMDVGSHWRDHRAISRAVEVDWPAVYQTSELAECNEAHDEELVARDRVAKKPLTLPGGAYAADFATQVSSLYTKCVSVYWRTPSYNYVRFVATMLSACIMGTIYFRADVQSVGGVIEALVTFVGLQNMMAVMPLVGLERVVFYRERVASYYDPWAYGIVNSIVEMPYALAQAVVYVGILYPLCGFIGSASHFFYFLCMTLLSLKTSTSHSDRYQDIPIYWKWLNRLAPTTWMMYGMAVDQLGASSANVLGLSGNTIPTVTQYLSNTFGYEYNFRFWCLLIVAAYVIFFRALSIFALRYISVLRR